MRVNIYAEEMTNRVEIISKEIEGRTFTGLRLYLELPVTFRQVPPHFNKVEAVPVDHPDRALQLKGPFVHHPGDDDSAAITFWGKRDLRQVLRLMLEKLDAHYASHAPEAGPLQADI